MDQKRYVVYVEDEALIRAMVTEALKGAGYSVVTTRSSKEAIEELFKLEVQGIVPVVLSDLIMPSSKGQGILGGLELVEKIKAQSPNVPIVMTTGYRGSGPRAEAYRFGVRNIVLKPEVKAQDPTNLQSSFADYLKELTNCLETVFKDQDMASRGLQLHTQQEHLVKELVAVKREAERVKRLSQYAMKTLTEDLTKGVSAKDCAGQLAGALSLPVFPIRRRGLTWEVEATKESVPFTVEDLPVEPGMGAFEVRRGALPGAGAAPAPTSLPSRGSLLLITQGTEDGGVMVHDRDDKWLCEFFLACLRIAARISLG